MKTDELTGAALDWAVAVAEFGYGANPKTNKYSTNWAQGGPIIEREMIDLQCLPTKQGGFIWRTVCADGHTPLIAAMRCYVATKLGDDIEIPEEFDV